MRFKIVIGLFFFTSIAFGNDTLKIRLFVNDIYELDLKKGTAKIDFYVNIYSNNRKTLQNNSFKLELMNGSILNEYTLNNFGDSKEIRMFCESRNIFSLNDIPFDSHKINLEFETNFDNKRIHFTALDSSLIINKNINLNGWNINNEVESKKIKMDYKLIRRGKLINVEYDRVAFKIQIKRLYPWNYFLKSNIQNIISLLLICLGFIINTKDIGNRFNLSLGSLFVLCSGLYQQMFLESNSFSIIDKTNLFFLCVDLSIITTFTLNYLVSTKRKSFSILYEILFSILLSMILFFTFLFLVS